MQRNNEFNISNAVLLISGLLLYIEINIKSSFLRIIKIIVTLGIDRFHFFESCLKTKRVFSIVFKTINNPTLKKDIWIIFINRIQPFEAANISATFFMCRTMMKHNSFHRRHFMRSCYIYPHM